MQATGKGGEAPADGPEAPRCIRCGHLVPDRPHGCKGPCPHCGFLYPLGDCTD